MNNLPYFQYRITSTTNEGEVIGTDQMDELTLDEMLEDIRSFILSTRSKGIAFSIGIARPDPEYVAAIMKANGR